MAKVPPYRLLVLGAVCSVERKEVRFNIVCFARRRCTRLLPCRWEGGGKRVKNAFGGRVGGGGAVLGVP